MAISVDAGDVVALLALLLSGYATWQTVSFNKMQNDTPIYHPDHWLLTTSFSNHPVNR